jgi:hypothetical protein
MTNKVDVQETVNALDGITASSFTSDADRFAAKEAARRLLARLETPFERGWSLAFETPVLVAGLQVGADLGIWERWVEAEKQNGGESVKLDVILGWCKDGVEASLLSESTMGEVEHGG